MNDNTHASFSRFKSIAVIGAGAWGTALARILSKNNGSVKIWAKEASVITNINTHHENETFLKNIKLQIPLLHIRVLKILLMQI